MPHCCISLGGNVGDVAATFGETLRRLRQPGIDIVRVSRVYRTAPVGPDANAFLNACAVIDTTLPPQRLLSQMQELENAAGRERSVRWGARTLDLDLLTYEDLVNSDPDLVLPHPGLLYRRFVLDPLAEIAPQWMHPVVHRTVEQLQNRLRRRPLPIQLACSDAELEADVRDRLTELWGRAIAIVEVRSEDSAPSDPTILTVSHAAPHAADRRSRGTPSRIQQPISVETDSRLAQSDPVAAAVAIVTAMLDQPQPVGTLNAAV